MVCPSKIEGYRSNIVRKEEPVCSRRGKGGGGVEQTVNGIYCCLLSQVGMYSLVQCQASHAGNSGVAPPPQICTVLYTVCSYSRERYTVITLTRRTLLNPIIFLAEWTLYMVKRAICSL